MPRRRSWSMRILLDESVPGRLGPLLTGHSTMTVQRRGWASIKNGKLLALAAGEFDVLLTADKGMEHQQNLATLPVAILIVLARSNRIEDLARAVPVILEALDQLKPRTLRKVSA
jgi:predicted nuclease of predicted toxin-antitoxin system